MCEKGSQERLRAAIVNFFPNWMPSFSEPLGTSHPHALNAPTSWELTPVLDLVAPGVVLITVSNLLPLLLGLADAERTTILRKRSRGVRLKEGFRRTPGSALRLLGEEAACTHCIKHRLRIRRRPCKCRLAATTQASALMLTTYGFKCTYSHVSKGLLKQGKLICGLSLFPVDIMTPTRPCCLVSAPMYTNMYVYVCVHIPACMHACIHYSLPRVFVNEYVDRHAMHRHSVYAHVKIDRQIDGQIDG